MLRTLANDKAIVPVPQQTSTTVQQELILHKSDIDAYSNSAAGVLTEAK